MGATPVLVPHEILCRIESYLLRLVQVAENVQNKVDIEIARTERAEAAQAHMKDMEQAMFHVDAAPFDEDEVLAEAEEELDSPALIMDEELIENIHRVISRDRDHENNQKALHRDLRDAERKIRNLESNLHSLEISVTLDPSKR